MCLNIDWPSFLHNLMTDFYFLKGELLIGGWKATESRMKVDWIVTEMCLPFSTFQSLKGRWKSHFSNNWKVGFFFLCHINSTPFYYSISICPIKNYTSVSRRYPRLYTKPIEDYLTVVHLYAMLLKGLIRTTY